MMRHGKAELSSDLLECMAEHAMADIVNEGSGQSDM